jgi:hypothetical protein
MRISASSEEKRTLLEQMGLPADYLGGKAGLSHLQRHGVSCRRGLPVPAGVLRQGTAKGTEPDAGSGQSEF